MTAPQPLPPASPFAAPPYDAPQIVRAENAAVGAWLRCREWTARYETGDILPVAFARAVATRAQLARLELVGLLERRGDDYVVHDVDVGRTVAPSASSVPVAPASATRIATVKPVAAPDVVVPSEETLSEKRRRASRVRWARAEAAKAAAEAAKAEPVLHPAGDANDANVHAVADAKCIQDASFGSFASAEEKNKFSESPENSENLFSLSQAGDAREDAKADANRDASGDAKADANRDANPPAPTEASEPTAVKRTPRATRTVVASAPSDPPHFTRPTLGHGIDRTGTGEGDLYAVGYARGIVRGKGEAWVFDWTPGEIERLFTLGKIFSTPEERKNIAAWLEREAEAFVRAVKEQAGYWSGYSPTQFQRWLNAGRPVFDTPVKLAKTRRGAEVEETPFEDVTVKMAREAREPNRAASPESIARLMAEKGFALVSGDRK
jgi:hypothetical protein